MKIDKDTQIWIKTNQSILRKIVEDRTIDYLNQVVDETDPQKKEILCMFVKELRMVGRVIENISNSKEDKKPEEEFTGM